MRFVDSTVIVDALRYYEPAILWLKAQKEQLYVSRIVQLEIIQGTRDRAEMRSALRVLLQFAPITPTQEDIDWAIDQQLSLHLRLRPGINDLLIAATCHRLSAEFFTHNLKHFTPLIGALALQPY
ncbi:MAG: PIN domain-containing protein [Chloroflexota bacterium]|nr:PIN domain-containing protein [Chloroflexota bacterium]